MNLYDKELNDLLIKHSDIIDCLNKNLPKWDTVEQIDDDIKSLRLKYLSESDPRIKGVLMAGIDILLDVRLDKTRK